MTKKIWPLQHFRHLMWLRAFGCPVEYPEAVQVGLRLKMKSSYLETNLYTVPDGTVLAFWLDIRAAEALTIHRLTFCSLWMKSPLTLLSPSARHRDYYCLPPGVWIPSSSVLNQALVEGSELQRNDHWAGFMLVTIPVTLSPNTGEQLEVVFSIEDLRGDEHFLVMTLINRPLDQKFLQTHSESATFPRRRKRVRTLIDETD